MVLDAEMLHYVAASVVIRNMSLLILIYKAKTHYMIILEDLLAWGSGVLQTFNSLRIMK